MSRFSTSLVLVLATGLLVVTGCDLSGSSTTRKSLDGAITNDTTLTDDAKHVVETELRVSNGATLTVEPGAELVFEAEAGLIVEENSVMEANGSADNPITMTATDGNAQQGWWRGIVVRSDQPNNLLNHVEVRHAGRGRDDPAFVEASASIIVDDGAALGITNSTVAQSGTFGVYLDGAGSTLEAFRANTFRNNARAPVYLPFSSVGVLDSESSFPEGKTVRVWDAVLRQDATMDSLSGNTTYRFTDDDRSVNPPTVDDEATLTINPGVSLRFDSGVGLNVNSGAALSAEGTAQAPITMTATAGNEQGGWWRGLVLFSDAPFNQLNHVELRHAGRGTAEGLSESAGVALDSGASLTLKNTIIAENDGYGVYLSGKVGTNATLNEFSENRFRQNARAPLYIPLPNVGVTDEGSDFAEGTAVHVVGGEISNGEVTLSALENNTPYRLEGRPAIGGSAELTIQPGVEMTFESDVPFFVRDQATLTAVGSADDPITMTAPAGNEQAGWWRGIGILSDSPGNRLNHVMVQHGGRSPILRSFDGTSNIGLSFRSTLEISNSTISDSDQHGVICSSGADLTRSGNTFQNIPGQNVKGCSSD